MWRTAIALAHSDHTLSEEEVELIRRYSRKFDFSEAERAQLEADFATAVEVDEVFPGITDKRDRAHLINFARVLFHIDGEFSEAEKKIHSLIREQHLATIDLDKVLEEARNTADLAEEQARFKQQQEKQDQNFFENAFEYLTGVDV